MAEATPFILLVDPNEEVAAQFGAAASGLPLAVKAVASPGEAWQVLSAEMPLAVVSEYRLGSSDGLWLLQQVGERLPSVKRILHTAARPHQPYGQDIPVLGKPCDPEALRDLLRALVAG